MTESKGKKAKSQSKKKRGGERGRESCAKPEEKASEVRQTDTDMKAKALGALRARSSGGKSTYMTNLVHFRQYV